MQNSQSRTQDTISCLMIIGIPHLQGDSICPELVERPMLKYPVSFLQNAVHHTGGGMDKELADRICSELNPYCHGYACLSVRNP